MAETNFTTIKDIEDEALIDLYSKGISFARRNGLNEKNKKKMASVKREFLRRGLKIVGNAEHIFKDLIKEEGQEEIKTTEQENIILERTIPTTLTTDTTTMNYLIQRRDKIEKWILDDKNASHPKLADGLKAYEDIVQKIGE